MVDAYEPSAEGPENDETANQDVVNLPQDLIAFARKTHVHFPRLGEDRKEFLEIFVSNFDRHFNAIHQHVPDRNMAYKAAINTSLIHSLDELQHIREKQGLQRRADHDELTGATVRGPLLEQVSAAIENPEPGVDTGVALVDIDYFKTINDTFGHQAGDQVLQGLVSLLQGELREGDLVSRFGGDEIAILLKDETGTKGPSRAVGRIRKIVQERLGEVLRGVNGVPKPPVVTVSIGVTTINERDENPNQIIDRADKFLYEAKRAGRNAAFDEFGRIDLDEHGNIVGR